jgi:hypothetical protein
MARRISPHHGHKFDVGKREDKASLALFVNVAPDQGASASKLLRFSACE